MRSLPQGIPEASRNFRWGIALLLQLIDEVVCGPQAVDIGGPRMEEAEERIHRAVERGDTETEEAAFADYMRAQVRESWQTFRERQLLIDLYRRAARRREGRGSPNSRRRPFPREGLRVARAMLANIAATARFDFAWESEAVSTASGGPMGVPRRQTPPCRVASLHRLRRGQPGLLRRSPVHREEASLAGVESIPRPLDRWRAKVDGERLRSPDRKPIPPHCPVRPAHLVRDVDIQFTIEVLRRVGVRPNGTATSPAVASWQRH